MKKMIASFSILAVMMTASFATPVPTQAAMMEGEKTALQEELVNVLTQIIAALTALVNGDTKMADTMMKDDTMTDVMMKGGKYTLTIDADLAELAEGHYEGWLIVGDEKISTGKYNAGDDMQFHFDTDIDDVEKVVITIEPEGDTDTIPSGVVVLAGDVMNGNVDLAFPVDFSDASGSVILATPTDGPDTNETSGIWFLNLPDPSVALDVPTLPDGWVYEGWGVHDGTPLTSGRFTDVAAADDFDGYSGPEAAPPFPGEDFLENAPTGSSFPIDLADGESVIVLSVEPDIDGIDPTGTGPAQAKPLLVHVAEGQADHENIALELNLDSVPSGSATLR